MNGMWGWLLKGVKWIGYAFRILKSTKEVLEDKTPDNDDDEGCDK